MYKWKLKPLWGEGLLLVQNLEVIQLHRATPHHAWEYEYNSTITITAQPRVKGRDKK